MSYHCLDCSFIGKQFPSGKCPACGSHNIKKTKTDAPSEEQKRPPYRLIICAGLWVYLAYALANKLL